MTTDRRISDLLLQYEELKRQGVSVTAEELCRTCPALLPELQARLGELEEMETGVDQTSWATKPPSDQASSSRLAEQNAPHLSGTCAIPGYEVLGVLGRGGMGVVYKARQQGLNRLVALKMILMGADAGKDELKRFRTEAEAVARLQHPNIVQIYEIGESNGLPYFSLEYVPGGTLARKINAAPQPVLKVLELVEVLARAIHAAHLQGIVHRDLKPANVLLTVDGIPKIADFGLAKKLDDEGQTHTGAIMGTPSYMAPEQARGDINAIGPAADIYALGAILYELLTGRPPFRAKTSWATVSEVLSREPVSPRRLNASVTRDLETICLKCLDKEPQRRYATAQDLAEDLHRLAAGEPIAARPVGKVQRSWRWCRRNPAQAGLVAALFLMAAAAIAAGVGYLNRDQTDPDVHFRVGAGSEPESIQIGAGFGGGGFGEGRNVVEGSQGIPVPGSVPDGFPMGASKDGMPAGLKEALAQLPQGGASGGGSVGFTGGSFRSSSFQQWRGALSKRQKTQIYDFKMSKGRTYVFDLESTAFNTVLKIQDREGTVLAENDDIGPDNMNSRISFSPKADGAYRLIIASAQETGVGLYTLGVKSEQ